MRRACAPLRAQRQLSGDDRGARPDLPEHPPLRAERRRMVGGGDRALRRAAVGFDRLARWRGASVAARRVRCAARAAAGPRRGAPGRTAEPHRLRLSARRTHDGPGLPGDRVDAAMGRRDGANPENQLPGRERERREGDLLRDLDDHHRGQRVAERGPGAVDRTDGFTGTAELEVTGPGTPREGYERRVVVERVE